MKRFDVVEAFTACVKSVGGISLDEEMRAPNFQNCDYWFEEHETAVELKCLSKNGFADEAFRQWLQNRHESWVQRGWAPAVAAGTTTVNLRDLAPQCYEEVLRKLTKKLESNLVRKANRQIRDTRHHFGRQKATGILVIANDGDYSLPPAMIKSALARLLLTPKYPCITNVIQVSGNTSVERQGDPNVYSYWVDSYMPGRRSAPHALIQNLQAAWRTEHQGRAGWGSGVIHATGEELYEMKFVGRVV